MSKSWISRPSTSWSLRSTVSWLTVGVIAAATAGCDDPLTLPQRIERTRVLAARVEVAAEPTRAWPAPGEDAVVHWLVVDPDPSIGFTWDLRACVARIGAVGLPRCDAAPFASDRNDVATPSMPVLSLTAPLASEGDELIFVHGVICARGIPSEDAGGCVGGKADGDRVALSIPLGGTEKNNNPSLEDDTIQLGGADWLEPAVVAEEGCATEPESPSLPILHAGENRTIELELRGNDRERVDAQQPSYGGEGAWETLQFSYFATGGTLNMPFSYVEANVPPGGQRLSVAWSAPAAGEEGVRVRFYIVVRDLRGGSDWARRDVCVVP